jgi:hypothetical protein
MELYHKTFFENGIIVNLKNPSRFHNPAESIQNQIIGIKTLKLRQNVAIKIDLLASAKNGYLFVTGSPLPSGRIIRGSYMHVLILTCKARRGFNIKENIPNITADA